MITRTTVKNRLGRKPYIFKDEVAYIMASSEMEVAHELPRDATSLSNELQQVIHDLGKQKIGKEIKQNSAQSYTPIVIRRVNKEE